MPGSGGKTIAVLGGGITGLTSAFTLARSLPQDAYRIVLIESQSRLGGHVHSNREPSTSALYEWGPRSIRFIIGDVLTKQDKRYVTPLLKEVQAADDERLAWDTMKVEQLRHH